ncbi:MAG: UDP-N-acetylmuramoyl-L-alanine--D-glutamate ligase, partial [Clostridiales Family XIII bacterium]|nr:UDP-N-acetylmuramoyl-L-alanine--D-glutamate ligase [Clostridiales Family XIII bacterium]
MYDLTGEKVIAAGLGKSGEAVVRTALALGARASAWDRKRREELDPVLLRELETAGVELYLGGDEPKGEFHVAVLSPGLPPGLPVFAGLEREGAEIIGELEFAFRAGKGRYAAITGTNGKTTTTALTGEMFRRAGMPAEVVGNIGLPASARSPFAAEDTWLVTEVSSFQLETVKSFRPEVSALLNLTPDHMDRHGTMENYGNIKARIFENQRSGDYFVVNRDDPKAWALASGCRAKIAPFSRLAELEFGACMKDGSLVIRDETGRVTRLCEAGELKIPGLHNLENALAAAAVAYFAGVFPGAISDALRGFTGVPHRLERVGTVNGVHFVNDSKGTNP